MMASHYIITILYFIILLAIGYVASKRIHNISDYYVGGKKLGFWVVAFSSRATGESAWLLLGLTGLASVVGLSAIWVVLGEVLGVTIAWTLMAKPFKRLTDEYQAITIPDYLVGRFKKHANSLRALSATALAIFVTIYVSAQIDATGKAFESFLGWDVLFSDLGQNAGYYIGVAVGFGIVVIYTFSGGFLAVAWSDLFQGILMLIGLLMLPLFAYFSLNTELFTSLSLIDSSLVNIWGKGGFNLANLLSIIALVAIGLGYLGSPQMFVRFISIKNENEIKKGTIVALAYTLIADLGAICIGLIGRVLLVGDKDIAAIIGKSGEKVLPSLVHSVFPELIVGLYIAAVLSAIMSTVDSLLVLASSAVTRDFYQKTFHPNKSDTELKRFSQIVTLSLAVIALLISLVVSYLSPDRTIFWFVIFGWSGITATFCPMIILSLFWKAYNVYGAFASMIVGFFSVPFFKFVAPHIGSIGFAFEKMEELFPSFLLSLFAGVIVTHLSKKND